MTPCATPSYGIPFSQIRAHAAAPLLMPDDAPSKGVRAPLALPQSPPVTAHSQTATTASSRQPCCQYRTSRAKRPGASTALSPGERIRHRGVAARLGRGECRDTGALAQCCSSSPVPGCWPALAPSHDRDVGTPRTGVPRHRPSDGIAVCRSMSSTRSGALASPSMTPGGGTPRRSTPFSAGSHGTVSAPSALVTDLTSSSTTAGPRRPGNTGTPVRSNALSH